MYAIRSYYVIEVRNNLVENNLLEYQKIGLGRIDQWMFLLSGCRGHLDSPSLAIA